MEIKIYEDIDANGDIIYVAKITNVYEDTSLITESITIRGLIEDIEDIILDNFG